MKIKILAILCLIALLLVSGCSKDSTVIATAAPTSSVYPKPAQTSSPSPTPIVSPAPAASSTPTPTPSSTPIIMSIGTDEYEILQDSYSGGEDITVSYPQIKGLGDTNRQTKINATLRQSAMSYFSSTMYMEDASELLTLDISYEISWQGENLLSIQYYGWDEYSFAPHPNKMYFTANINMQSGEIIELDDLFYADEVMMGSIIKNSRYVSPLDIDDAHLMDEMRNYMLDYLSNYNLTDNQFSFTKDSLWISIEVPHAIGGHAEFGVKYSDLINSIRPENEVWEDFKDIQNKAAGVQSQLSHDVTLSDLYQFTEFEDQSFDVDLTNWGAVRFVSGRDFGGKLRFFLTDDTDTILYRFPDYYDNYWQDQTVSAVAFRDVNEDSFEDIIIITVRNDTFWSCDIYFQSKRDFVQVPDLHDDLNHSVSVYDTVDKIVEYMETKGKAIVGREMNNMVR